MNSTRTELFGVLLAFSLVCLILVGMVRCSVDLVRYGHEPLGAPVPSACVESAHALDPHDAPIAVCPAGTRVVMHSESRALCVCPSP